MSETIAFDFNPFCSRAVLVDAYGGVLSHVDTKTSSAVAKWVDSTLDHHPHARVVASPLDDCPDVIGDLLRLRDKRTDLLRPILCRALYHAARPWNLSRKLHRARLLAHLDRWEVQPYNLEHWLREFEHERARETLAT